jgi:hypothetical protein
MMYLVLLGVEIFFATGPDGGGDELLERRPIDAVIRP